MGISDVVTSEVLTAHCCLEKIGRVAGDRETTKFRRRARLKQALERESQGLPIGMQPMQPQVGSPSLFNRLKMLKREMYGRTKLDLLEKRIVAPH